MCNALYSTVRCDINQLYLAVICNPIAFCVVLVVDLDQIRISKEKGAHGFASLTFTAVTFTVVTFTAVTFTAATFNRTMKRGQQKKVCLHKFFKTYSHENRTSRSQEDGAISIPAFFQVPASSVFKASSLKIPHYRTPRWFMRMKTRINRKS